MEPDKFEKLFRRPLTDEQLDDVLLGAMVRIAQTRGRDALLRVLSVAVDELSDPVAR